MTPANRPPDAAIDPISVIMLDLENKARAEMARRDAREEALTKALRRSQGWLAVFVWPTLLLVLWGVVVVAWRWM